ncbi:MAG: type II secretion system F family protein [Chloroflexota bacterium]
MNLVILIGGGLLFLVLLGVGVALLAGDRSVNVDQRLDQISAGAEWEPEFIDPDAAQAAEKGPELADRLDEVFENRGYSFVDRIRTRIARGDLKLRVSEYIMLIVLMAIFLGGVAWYLFDQSLTLGFIGVVAGCLIPGIYSRYAAGQRIQTFNNQLSDTLNLWVNALRSGFSVLQAMEAIANEMPAPVSQEFERVIQEVRLGKDTEEALDNVLRRVPSEDFDLVVTAVKVQREVGGNLSEILDTISFTIRERVRIKGEIQTLTAQGRISGWIITALPIALGLFLYYSNPEYIGELFVQEPETMIAGLLPCGWIMVGVAVIMIAVGGFSIQKIIDIEV